MSTRRKGLTYAEHVAIAKVYRQALHDLSRMSSLLAIRYGVTSKPYKDLVRLVGKLENQPRCELDNLEHVQAAREGILDHVKDRFIYYDSALTKPDNLELCPEEWLAHIMGGA